MAQYICPACGAQRKEEFMIIRDGTYYCNSDCASVARQTELIVTAFQSSGGGGGMTIEQIKADTDIASAIALKHDNSTDHAPGSDDQDLSGLVVKETGKSLVPDSEIAKIHANTLDHSHSNKATLDAYSQTEEDLADAVAKKHTSGSDITKAAVESVLTGEISSHTHAGGGGGSALGTMINVQALTSSPADGATIYFGMLPKAPTTTANASKIYIRKACTLKVVEVYCYSGTAGTSEEWNMYVRKNNTTDTLIATLSIATNERVFSNSSLAISLVAGDYLEMKCVNPTWATNPATTIFGGYLYFE